jgi:uncharacterized membrane protein YkvA (DUF1232 family)
VAGIPLAYVALAIVACTLVALPAIYVLARFLEKREPYASLLRLRGRAKVRFFRLLLADTRVPRKVKLLPFLLIPYLAMPFDLVPDFIPVLGYLDDVAIVLGMLALVIRLTPRAVIDDLFVQAGAAGHPGHRLSLIPFAWLVTELRLPGGG